MAESEDSGLLAIEVDADDYADAAASDTPQVPRTYQSEADFQAIKSAYTAKVDGVPGNETYQDLIAAVSVLGGSNGGDGVDGNVIDPVNGSRQDRCDGGGSGKARLGKKDVQLLGYAVGQLYFERQYSGVVALCERVRERCVVDEKTGDGLERWMRRCKERGE